jgi:Bacterial regulatory protein, Fis family
LNVFPIQVPPLRKRREDIPILVEYFVKRFAEKMGKRIHRIDKRTLALCERYPWPGNIRELQNIVERSVILCSGEPFSIDEAWLSTQTPLRTDESGPLPEALQDQEKEMIEAALTKSRGKVAGPRGAAAKLGIPASTLESKIRQFPDADRRPLGRRLSPLRLLPERQISAAKATSRPFFQIRLNGSRTFMSTTGSNTTPRGQCQRVDSFSHAIPIWHWTRPNCVSRSGAS